MVVVSPPFGGRLDLCRTLGTVSVDNNMRSVVVDTTTNVAPMGASWRIVTPDDGNLPMSHARGATGQGRHQARRNESDDIADLRKS